MHPHLIAVPGIFWLVFSGSLSSEGIEGIRDYNEDSAESCLFSLPIEYTAEAENPILL
jgi:hypothetical protein